MTRRTPAVAFTATVAAVAVLVAALAATAATRASDRVAGRVGGTADVTAVLAAARAEVADALSYDYRHLDADIRRATAVMTPAFRKKYLTTTGKVVRPLATKYKTVSTAEITAAGLVTGSRDRAEVLVFVSQTATNTQLSAPRLDRSRVRTFLVRSGGRWLIDDLRPV